MTDNQNRGLKQRRRGALPPRTDDVRSVRIEAEGAAPRRPCEAGRRR
jgi:hypothetical protein